MFVVDYTLVPYDVEMNGPDMTLGPFNTLKEAMRAGNKKIKEGQAGYASYDVYHADRRSWKPLASGELKENGKVKTDVAV